MKQYRNIPVYIKVTKEERSMIEQAVDKLRERSITDTLVKLVREFLDKD